MSAGLPSTTRGLVAGGAVAGRHAHAFALRGGRERRDDLAPAWLGNGVGDEGQRGVGGAAVTTPGDVAGSATARREQRGGDGERSGGCSQDLADVDIDGLSLQDCGETRHDGKAKNSI